MKKLIASFIAMLFAVPAVSSAQGLYCRGYVYISTNTTTGDTYMAGMPNVRWSTTPSTRSEYVNITSMGDKTSSVTIGMMNANGQYAYCYVTSNSAYFDTAKRLASQNNNGLYLYTYKTATSNECQFIYTSSDSCRLD